jgi:aminoglycoside 3-N-acetyltransferase I
MEAQNSESFSIVQLSKSHLVDLQKLIRLFAAVFEDVDSEMPDAAYLENLLARPDFLALAVVHNNAVVGGLTGYELQKYQSKASEFFVYDIAVDPAFQRRGLGTRLIARLTEICRERGITHFFVDAHQDDVHALKFYESMTQRQDAVVQFSFKV